MPATPVLWYRQGEIAPVGGQGAFGTDRTATDAIQLANGNLLLAWDSDQTGGPGAPPETDILGQIYDPLGNPVSGPFRINGGFNGDLEKLVDLAPLPGGGFVAAFIDRETGAADQSSIRLCEFDAAGTVDNQATLLFDGVSDGVLRTDPRIEVGANGLVVLTFKRDDGAPTGAEQIVARTYDPATDSVGPPAQSLFSDVGFDPQGDAGHIHDHAIAALDNGNFIAVGALENNDDVIVARMLNAAGEALGALAFTIEEAVDLRGSQIDVAALGQSGRYVVTWADTVGGNSEIRAQILGETGITLPVFVGPVFQPNTGTAGDQYDPAVTELTDGTFVIVWSDGHRGEVFGQRFDADGNPIGEEFAVSDPTGDPVEPSDTHVEALEDGRFLVIWQEESRTTTSPGTIVSHHMHSAILDPRDAANEPAVYPTEEVIGTVGDDVINVVPGDERVFGWNGDDRLLFDVQDADGSDRYDGGAGFDRLSITGGGLNDFRGAEILGIEAIEFNFNLFPPASRTVKFEAGQFGAGKIAADAVFEGAIHAGGDANAVTVEIHVSQTNTVEFGTLQFQNWNDDNSQDYRFRIIGDGSDESITGTDQNDEIDGNGGDDGLSSGEGDDTLTGGPGRDTLQAGPGADRLVIDAGDADFGAEIWNGGPGIDEVVFEGGRGAAEYDLRGFVLAGLEALSFGTIAKGGDREVRLDAAQIGPGLAGDATITGLDLQGSDEVLHVFMGAETSLDLSGFSFVGWGGQDELVRITGDGDAETMTGSSQDNRFDGMGGDDTFILGAAENLVFGGPGEDSAVLPGPYRDYQVDIGVGADPTVITHAQTGAVSELHDIETLEFSNGSIPNDNPPTVTIADETVAPLERLPLGPIPSVDDPEGDLITKYQIFDPGGDSNWWVTGEGEIAPHVEFEVSSLSGIHYQGESQAGTETLTVRAFDGQSWSEWESFTLTTTMPQDNILETGTLTLTHAPTTVTLQRSYENPVVIAYVATENGAQPVNVRVSDVSDNDLTLQLQEPNHLDGAHVNETVNYMVVEAGTWLLPDGTVLEAGTLNSNKLSSQGFETVAFDAAFDSAPVILSQVQSFIGGDFVTTRQRDANTDGFQLTMQEEEALNGGAHVTETIGWVALEPGSGTAGDVSWLAGSTSGVTDANTRVGIVSMGRNGSNVMPALASFDGPDPAWARGNGNSSSSFDVSVEEDTSLDAETKHTAETVDYFAFDQAGTISAAPIQEIAETGTLSLNHTVKTVTLQRSYENPVVIAYVATENGAQPVNVRVSDVIDNDLTLQLQEPNRLDGAHVNETVNYMVVEAGTWVLPDGTILEAGTLNSNKLSSQGFETVAFDAEFDGAPVILSQVQSFNGGDFVTTRQRDADTDGFQLTMQEEEALNGGAHVTETIGWVALEPGSGTAGDVSWLAGSTSGVTDANTRVGIVSMGRDGSNVMPALASFDGPDPAWARGNGDSSSSFDVSVEEDTSLDAKTKHTAETVDYFAFNQAGVVGAYDYDFFV